MDGITEPVVLILGHPIAGNPAQFALERSFAALKLEWRVLSCDVPPHRIGEAILGAEVLGFRGLLLDQNLLVPRLSDGSAEDCFFRDDLQTGWQSENALTLWLEQTIGEHFQARGREVGPLLRIGTPDPRFPSGITDDETQSPIAWASAESIEHANLIAITEPIDVSQWPTDEDETLVIDLSPQPNNVETIRALGYHVRDGFDARIGILMGCFQRWTGKLPAIEIMTEAVEEYLAV